MACYHPLKGFIIGLTKNGKRDLLIRPYDTECVYQPFIGAEWESHGYKLDPSIFRGRIVTNFVPIPCGQCIGCRLEYSRQWAIRCMLESEYYDSNYFLTLTYDDDHVPVSEYVDDDGVIHESLTLEKTHLQKFCKDLRRKLDYNNRPSFRFFSCGEYGSQTARPHYHMIAFGLELDDLVKFADTPTGTLYISEFLSSTWKRGYVIIGGVSFESCAYVSRYIMKKRKGIDSHVYSDFNISPEFTNCSRRPGIGADFLAENFQNIYPDDHVILPGGRVTRPPRFFDMKMDEIDEELMNNVRANRRDIAERLQRHKDNLTSADYQMQLVHAENNKESQIKRLVRPL